MEHRHNSRTRTALKVIVFNKGLPVAVGKTKNISRSGLFVRSVYLDELSLHQPLEIQFVPSGQRVRNRVRVKVCVVHLSALGFGLELVDTSAAATEVMNDLLELEIDRLEMGRLRSRAVPQLGAM